MSEVKTDKLSPRTASGTLTLGTSGDTFSIPSGGTLTIDSGGTITNNGTASGLGGLIPISETVTSSQASTIDITLPSPSSYSGYKIQFESMNPVVSGSWFRAYFSEDGGSNWQTGSSYWNITMSGSPTTYCSLTGREDISVQNSVDDMVFNLELYNINNEGVNSVLWTTTGAFVSYENGLMYNVQALGRYERANAINAIRIYTHAGDIQAGLRYKIYGVVDI